MEEIQNNPTNLCEDVLAHHGRKGMKWGIRRFQPYPDDYTGDGKFVGKKSSRAERRQARHVAKTNTRIKNAVDTGNKKKLKKYKDEMSPEEYEKKYAETVKNGIDNAVKDRDKSALKKYKDDLNKREYQHQKNRIEFKDAIDNDNSRKTKKLLSKVDPEDVTEATNLIRSRVALQDQKLSKIRQDSELMARMDKLASGLGKVSKISQNVSNITSSFMSVNKSMMDFANAQKDVDKKRKEKELEKVIRSGDLKKIRENEKKMTQQQLNEAYDRIIQSGSEEDIKKAAPYMNNKQVTAAVQKLSQMDKLISSKKEDTPVEEAKNSPAVQVVTDWIESSQFDNMNLGGTTVGNLRDSFTRWEYQNTGSRATPHGFRHSDDISYEDVLAHHDILGMKWGIRRYQPYPKGYKGDGKEIGKRAEAAIENTIRTYSDARAYVLGIGLDQAVNRMGWLNEQYGTTDKIAKIAGGTGRTALNEMGFTPQTISDLNTLVTNTGNVSTQILNNPNTANYINQLATAGTNATIKLPNNGVTINVPEITQQTLGTRAAIDEIVAGSTPRQGDITRRPMNSSVPVSQQRKTR